MGRTIGIIAPLIDTGQFNMDFTLRIRKNKRDLTLAAFYELANAGFKIEKVSRGVDYGENIPAGGYYLEGLLHQSGYDTLLTNKADPESLRKIAEEDPFCICISTTMILTTRSLLELFSLVRRTMPGIPIIAGGMFIWKHYLHYHHHFETRQSYPLQPWMLFHPDHAGMEADILVISQHGRASLLEVLKELSKGRKASFDHIPNLCMPESDGFSFSTIEEEHVDYNEDYTRWDLINEIPERIPLRTSIGCPFRCRFCDFCKVYPRIFLRSGKSLIQELSLAKKMLGQNMALIHIADENVFVNKSRLFEVCNAISDSGLGHWIGFIRGGEYSDEEMTAIQRSGLMLGEIGVESGDQGQLDRMNKKQKVENMKRGIEQLDAHGISVLMTFVVGFPGETRQSLQNTADFMNDLRLKNLSVGYHLYPLLILPLSELAEPKSRARWKIEGDMRKWSHSTMNSDEANKACYDLFKEVTNIPYSYYEESFFFNRAKFRFDTRKSLYQLRQKLTIGLIESEPWGNIEPLLQEMALLMKVPTDTISEELRTEILVPSIKPE
jgi:radical SAM superfamily enzyme YgiQ (UPF0313 family)